MKTKSLFLLLTFFVLVGCNTQKSLNLEYYSNKGIYPGIDYEKARAILKDLSYSCIGVYEPGLPENLKNYACSRYEGHFIYACQERVGLTVDKKYVVKNVFVLSKACAGF